ncbi:antirestriction protein, partial [Salmonella enterica subsp. enterica serovar Senftenberg]|nr:antirestriction protein [Salmonella enterica subsp. enterica serovar Senftenberg]
FKTDKFQRYCVTDGDERLDFIPALFFTPSADNMIASWLRQHSNYDGGFWNYWIIPQGVGGNVAPNRIIFTTTQTGYI